MPTAPAKGIPVTIGEPPVEAAVAPVASDARLDNWEAPLERAEEAAPETDARTEERADEREAATDEAADARDPDADEAAESSEERALEASPSMEL